MMDEVGKDEECEEIKRKVSIFQVACYEKQISEKKYEYYFQNYYNILFINFLIIFFKDKKYNCLTKLNEDMQSFYSWKIYFGGSKRLSPFTSLLLQPNKISSLSLHLFSSLHLSLLPKHSVKELVFYQKYYFILYLKVIG